METLRPDDKVLTLAVVHGITDSIYFGICGLGTSYVLGIDIDFAKCIFLMLLLIEWCKDLDSHWDICGAIPSEYDIVRIELGIAIIFASSISLTSSSLKILASRGSPGLILRSASCSNMSCFREESGQSTFMDPM